MDAENKNKILDIPIDPNALKEDVLSEWWMTESEMQKNVVTNHVTADSNFFVIIHRIAAAIADGTKWNKKARIVLEYDPQEEKMRIATIMEYDEAIQLEPFAGWFRERQQ